MVLMERSDKPPHRGGWGWVTHLDNTHPRIVPLIRGTSEAEGVSYTPKVYYSEIK